MSYVCVQIYIVKSVIIAFEYFRLRALRFALCVYVLLLRWWLRCACGSLGQSVGVYVYVYV